MLSTPSCARSARTASRASRLPWMSLTMARFMDAIGRVGQGRRAAAGPPNERRWAGTRLQRAGPTLQLPSRHQTVAEGVVEVGDGIDFTSRFVAGILQAAEDDRVVVEDDVAGPRV